MDWKSYFSIDFAFVVFFGGLAVFSLIIVFLGVTGIKTTW